MGIELDPKWQEEAYEQISNDFSTGNRSCVVAPTGCGKTALGLKLMEENPNGNFLWVTSSSVAIREIKGLIQKVYGIKEPFPNLKIMTYNALSNMNEEQFDKLNPSTVIFDELHRAGAPIWEIRVKELLENNKHAKILGLTATPIRTDGKNMANAICGGISYQLELTEAMAREILPIPIYICTKYIFDEDIQEMEEAIDAIGDIEKRNEIHKLMEEATRKLHKAQGIQEIFEKHMTKSNGKYIIFCNTIKHIDEIEALLMSENRVV